jgi:hypothetical protein
MIISLRSKSEINYLQNSSQLRLLRKCNFRDFDVFSSYVMQSLSISLSKHVVLIKISLSKHVMCF